MAPAELALKPIWKKSELALMRYGSSIATGLLATMVLTASSCRSRLDANANYVEKEAPVVEAPAPAGPEPVDETTEIDDGIVAPKVRFQTRNVIRLTFSGQALALGDSVRLVNKTTGKTLLEGAPLQLADDSSFEGTPLALLGNGDVQAELYPMADAAKALVYGKNVLRLEVLDDATGGAVSEKSIELRDFDVPPASVSTGESAVAEEGHRLEGGFGFAAAVTSQDGSLLTLGAHAVVDR